MIDTPGLMYRYDYRKLINKKPDIILKEKIEVIQSVEGRKHDRVRRIHKEDA